MAYIALGCLVLLMVLRAGAMPVFKARGWKYLTAGCAVAAFAGAAFAGLREAWVPAVVLLVMGLWLATSARRSGAEPRAAASRDMSENDARAILGVEASASPAEIRAAHRRLMRLAHPDTGGTTGLASQLNAARDRLLKS